MFYKYRHLLMWFVFIFFLSFSAMYYYTTSLPGPLTKLREEAAGTVPQQSVSTDTRVYLRERYALCEKYNLSCKNEVLLEGAARMEMNGLSLNDVIKKYPAEAGWTVDWEGTTLSLQQGLPGLCPQHQNCWHLAGDETGKKVAVYLGPAQVGPEGGLIRTTEIMIDKLPLDLQQKIAERYFEFLTWDELIATLDSISEEE